MLCVCNVRWADMRARCAEGSGDTVSRVAGSRSSRGGAGAWGAQEVPVWERGGDIEADSGSGCVGKVLVVLESEKGHLAVVTVRNVVDSLVELFAQLGRHVLELTL